MKVHHVHHDSSYAVESDILNFSVPHTHCGVYVHIGLQLIIS